MDVQDWKMDFMHLGSISETTRGIEPIGPIEEETGERYSLLAGLSDED